VKPKAGHVYHCGLSLQYEKAGLIPWPVSWSTSPANSPAVGSAQLAISTLRLRVDADSSPAKACPLTNHPESPVLSSLRLSRSVAPPSSIPDVSADCPLGPRHTLRLRYQQTAPPSPSRLHSRGLKPLLWHGFRSHWQ
jgi:hypothetical protein